MRLPEQDLELGENHQGTREPVLDRPMAGQQPGDLLLTDPEKALAEYKLTPIEMEAVTETELAEIRMRPLSSESGPEGAHA